MDATHMTDSKPRRYLGQPRQHVGACGSNLRPMRKRTRLKNDRSGHVAPIHIGQQNIVDLRAPAGIVACALPVAKAL